LGCPCNEPLVKDYGKHLANSNRSTPLSESRARNLSSPAFVVWQEYSGGELSGSDVWSVSLLLLRGGAGAPAISTSPEPVIALNNVDRSHKCSAPFSKVPASPCACFAHRTLHLLEQASSASARLDSEYLLRKELRTFPDDASVKILHRGAKRWSSTTFVCRGVLRTSRVGGTNDLVDVVRRGAM
jgi:hypothetical protein